ncbi:NINE protein [Paenibacillus amylolyticus]|uniref:NINE protein n=1 Tax=Paenibacillus amylolyticus TaxID=1451 RepID=UPI00324274B8
MSKRSKIIDLLLCLFLGVFGIHRFYEGKIVTGILYIFTIGFLGLGVLIDLLQIIFGCRTDKNKLPIGKPNKKLGKIAIVLSVLIATVLWLLFGFLIFKQILNQPMIEKEYYNKVDAAYPIEKKYTRLGEFKTSDIEFKSDEKLFDKFKVWYPSLLEQSSEKHPIVVIANGTGVPFSKFSEVFKHLASWGFVVIGNDDDSSWSGQSSSDALKFILGLNSDTDSIFYDKLDTNNIGISGHSQGGVGAINAVTRFSNSDMFTSIYTASTTGLELAKALKWDYDVTQIKIPYFMLASTGKSDADLISPYESLYENYSDLSKGIPAVMARRKNVEHGHTLSHADGYMTAWFRYTLMNDNEASKVFRGDALEIMKNTTNWQDVRVKNLD